MMASRKKRRIRHYPNQYQIPIKSTQYPQGQRRPRFPFFLPNNVKEQKTTNPKEPAITATQKAQTVKTPAKQTGIIPQTLQRKRSRRKRSKAPAPMPSVLRPGPPAVNSLHDDSRHKNKRAVFGPHSGGHEGPHDRRIPPSFQLDAADEGVAQAGAEQRVVARHRPFRGAQDIGREMVKGRDVIVAHLGQRFCQCH